MTKEQFTEIGKMIRDSHPITLANPIGSMAIEHFTIEKIHREDFNKHNDEELGRKFVEWYLP